jgi:hypothetical protein
MGWQVAIAIVIGAAFVLLVVRSMFQQWRSPDEQTPLRGRLSAAREWLEANGYQVVQVRARSEWIGYYDAREFRKQLIADFIVRQGAKYYAVKVASGRETGINGAKLRDQWYPLYTAFQVHGILHIDLDREQAHMVDFDLKPPRYVIWRKAVNRGLWLLSGVVIAFAWLHMR